MYLKVTSYNSSDFLTMKWRPYGINNRNVLIKTMIDVSRVDWDGNKSVSEMMLARGPKQAVSNKAEQSITFFSIHSFIYDHDASDLNTTTVFIVFLLR